MHRGKGRRPADHNAAKEDHHTVELLFFGFQNGTQEKKDHETIVDGGEGGGGSGRWEREGERERESFADMGKMLTCQLGCSR